MPLFLCSAALHEAGHLAALRLLRVPIRCLELRGTGAVLHTGQMRSGKEALCTAAGPLMNGLLLLTFSRIYPPLALVNLILLAYNLLPLYPLDGGRLLRLCLCAVFGTSAGERGTKMFTTVLVFGLAGFSAALSCVFHVGLWPCLLAAVFLCKCANTPCKIGRRRLKWKQKKRTEVCYD